MASTCPRCHAQVPIGATTCPVCNSPLTDKSSNVIAALTYLLGVVTGVIFLYLEPYDRDEYVRFHARQSIAFSVAWFALNIIAGVFIAVLPGPLSAILFLFERLLNIAFAVAWIYLMYQAYIGNRFRLPVLADWVEGAGF
ncbi:MAG TPA: DUF4870 domain-containing protein [Candidatus Binataceae bacterium]|nr:DUF4870 domain-containing protein [Candidatus Binataceae bacterium]